MDFAYEGPIDKMVEIARSDPDKSRVIWRLNQGEWKTATGREFLAIWEQSIAGTIFVDRVVILP